MWQMIVGAFFIVVGFSSIAEDFMVFLVGFLLGAAFLIWGLHKKNIINIRKLLTGKAAPPPVARTIELRAVGVSYYTDNIQSLARPNPGWSRSAKEIIAAGDAGRRIFRYNYIHAPMALVREPENPHDKNAIAVKVDEKTVGYVSHQENIQVSEILSTKSIQAITGFIGGGDCKVVDHNGHIFEEEVSNSVIVRIHFE